MEISILSLTPQGEAALGERHVGRNQILDDIVGPLNQTKPGTFLLGLFGFLSQQITLYCWRMR